MMAAWSARARQLPFRRHLRAGMLGLAVLIASCVPRINPEADRAPADISLDARLLQMVDRRLVDTTVLDLLLHDASAPRRARAALAVGQVKIKARYPVLRQLLVDPDTAVAANAAFALGLAHDTLGVAALARAVAGAPDVVAREAAWALGEIGEPARAVIALALGDGVGQAITTSPVAQRGPVVRAALLLSTVKLRPVPLGGVLPWLADPAPEVARAAAYVVGRQRLPGGVRALLTVRKHPDEELRQHVARGLSRQAAGDSLGQAARDALVALLRDESARVRVNAARSLGSYGPNVRAEIERALGDVDASVRIATAEVVQAVFAQDTSAWRRAWTRDTTFRVREQLMSAARGAGVAILEAEEATWAARPEWSFRAAVLSARAADARVDHIALAREFSRDRDARVRASALGVIAADVNDSAARVVAEPAVNDGDVQVRAAALTILARRARADDADRGVAGFERAVSDTDGDARAAALKLIAAAWQRDSARMEARTFGRLATIAGPATASERRLLQGVTPAKAWASSEPRGVSRAIGDYERLLRQWGALGAKQPIAVIHTERGDITVELFGADAPLVVEAFITLAKNGFYRESVFHRVVPNFVVQDGDPRGDGSGGPGFSLRESYSRRRHERGALGLATSGPDTGGSQYYLCHSTQPHLDGGYTVFGRVTAGFDVLDRVIQGARMTWIEIR